MFCGAIWRVSPMCAFAQYSQNWFGVWTWLIWFSVRYSEHGKEVLGSMKGGVTEDMWNVFSSSPWIQTNLNAWERFVRFIYNSKELSVFLCTKSGVANHCSLCSFLSDMHYFCGNTVPSMARVVKFLTVCAVTYFALHGVSHDITPTFSLNAWRQLWRQRRPTMEFARTAMT
jgi:hypothetical protein